MWYILGWGWYNMVFTWLRLVQCGIYFARFIMHQPLLQLYTQLRLVQCGIYFARFIMHQPLPQLYTWLTLVQCDIYFAMFSMHQPLPQLHTLQYRSNMLYYYKLTSCRFQIFPFRGCSQYQRITILGVYTLVKSDMYSRLILDKCYYKTKSGNCKKK